MDPGKALSPPSSHSCPCWARSLSPRTGPTGHRFLRTGRCGRAGAGSTPSCLSQEQVYFLLVCSGPPCVLGSQVQPVQLPRTLSSPASPGESSPCLIGSPGNFLIQIPFDSDSGRASCQGPGPSYAREPGMVGRHPGSPRGLVW